MPSKVLVITGTHSGVGKTTITLGIMFPSDVNLMPICPMSPMIQIMVILIVKKGRKTPLTDLKLK